MYWFKVTSLLCLTFTMGVADFIDPTDLFNIDQMNLELSKKHIKEVKEPDVEILKDGMPETPSLDSTEPSNEFVPDETKENSQSNSSPLYEEFEKKKESASQNSSHCEIDKETKVVSTLFQQFVMNLVQHSQRMVGSSIYPEEFCLAVKVTQHDLSILQKFGEGDMSHLYAAHEKLSSMVMYVRELPDTSSPVLWLQDRFGLSPSVLLLIIAAFLAFSLTVKTLMSLRLTFFTIKKVLVAVFVASVMFTWFEMYQKKVAAKERILMDSLRDRCPQLGNLSTWEWIKNAFSSSLTFQDEDCKEFYEAMFISPVTQVTVFEAVSVTFVKTFVSPLKIIGEGLKDLFTGLFKGLPFQLAVILMPLVYIVVITLPLMVFRYKIRIPFLLSIEPSAQPQALPAKETVPENAIRPSEEQGQVGAAECAKCITTQLSSGQQATSQLLASQGSKSQVTEIHPPINTQKSSPSATGVESNENSSHPRVEGTKSTAEGIQEVHPACTSFQSLLEEPHQQNCMPETTQMSAEALNTLNLPEDENFELVQSCDWEESYTDLRTDKSNTMLNESVNDNNDLSADEENKNFNLQPDEKNFVKDLKDLNVRNN